MTQTHQWQAGGVTRWRRHWLPILVWMAAIGITGWLFSLRAASFDTVGIARGEQRSIASQDSGRILLLPVNLFEQVKQGQTLAVMQDDRIQAQLATARAEAARLRAELAATEDQLIAEARLHESDRIGEARRFAVDLEKKRIEDLELTATIKKNKISLEYLQIRKDALAELYKLNATTEYDWREAETEYRKMAIAIEQDQNRLAQVQADLRAARQRQETYAQQVPSSRALEKAIEPLRAAVTVQEHVITELSIDHSMRVLRSPMDGIVSQVLRRVGEAVMPGEPVLIVASTRPADVVAYVNAAQAVQVGVGTPVEMVVSGRGDSRTKTRSQVIAVGPAAEQLPARLWLNPAVPEWGWPISIAVTPGSSLLPGELVGVRGLSRLQK